MIPKRVIVYVDGFNLYHALDDLNQDHLKWLDLWSLSEKLIAKNGLETIVAVKYFTAFATWRPESLRLHQKYVAALKARNVTVILGRFKEKRNRCKSCGVQYISHEEKETDVNIGSHLISDGLRNRYDRAIVISADTDLNGVVDLARQETDEKIIHLVTPPGRHSRNRAALFAITRGRIKQSLLPETCQTKEGKTIVRPTKYQPPVNVD